MLPVEITSRRKEMTTVDAWKPRLVTDKILKAVTTDTDAKLPFR